MQGGKQRHLRILIVIAKSFTEVSYENCAVLELYCYSCGNCTVLVLDFTICGNSPIHCLNKKQGQNRAICSISAVSTWRECFGCSLRWIELIQALFQGVHEVLICSISFITREILSCPEHLQDNLGTVHISPFDGQMSDTRALGSGVLDP